MAIYRIASGTVTDASLRTCVAIGTGNTGTIANMILTNIGAAITEVSVYVYSGSTQRLLKTVKLPAGAGKTRIIFEAIGGINQGDSIRVQGDGSSDFNYHIFGNILAA